MSRFSIERTPIQGLVVARRQRRTDERGYFERMFCEVELAPLLAGRRVVQINHTLTKRVGAVRGLHFQRPPHAETKLVTCVRGEVFDVAVDIRRGSPTFMHWHGVRLSADEALTYVIPEGFAHGFQALAPDSELLYFHTAAYDAGSEGGVDAADPRLAVAWPLPITERSERDLTHPRLDESSALDVSS